MTSEVVRVIFFGVVALMCQNLASWAEGDWSARAFRLLALVFAFLSGFWFYSLFD